MCLCPLWLLLKVLSQVDYRLIPSLDGSLYKYEDGVLQALPVNSDMLLGGQHSSGHRDIISGGKQVITYGLNVYSGDVKLLFSPLVLTQGCNRNSFGGML